LTVGISLVFDRGFAQNRDVIRVLLTYTSIVFVSVRALFRCRSEQAIVELALRQQLATYMQAGRKPRLTLLDRPFWVALSRYWLGWKDVLVIVKPDTVVHWHRRGFRLYWRWRSKRGPTRKLRLILQLLSDWKSTI
jgi:hypothetical protein